MNLKQYKNFYVNDENHWYISKVKQITEDSINEMSWGLFYFWQLLKQNPDRSVIKAFKSFVPRNPQLSLFLDDDESKQVILSPYSKLYLSLRILSEGLITPTQVSFKNPQKHQTFTNIVNEFQEGRNYRHFQVRYSTKYLTDELEIYYRNFESWLTKFGFMGRIADSEYCFFTEIGLQFLRNRDDKEMTSAIFLNQIKKIQIWNPSIDQKYRAIRVVPYFAILEVLLNVEGNKFNKNEYVLFITKINSHEKEEISKCVDLIHQYRTLSKENAELYVEEIKKLDSRRFPDRPRTNFERLLDSSTKEISAYTFGGISTYNKMTKNFELVNITTAVEELANFHKSVKYIEFVKKEDWVRHLGSLNGLSIDDILDIYVNEGKSLNEILNSLKIDDLQIEQQIKEKLFEKEIEEYYERNLHEIDPNLKIVETPYGRQFPTPIGPIDILCQHTKTNEYYVLEFKRSQVSDDTIGQILRYMGWVYLIMEKSKRTVNGIIIGSEFPDKIHYALHGVQSHQIFKILNLFQHDFTEKNRPRKK